MEKAAEAPGGEQKQATNILLSGGAKFVDVASSEINHLLAGELDSEMEVFDCTEFNPDKQCIKNKGAAGRNYNYSRGYQFMVCSTGPIEAFAPLFRAESLGQVYLFIISWMCQRLQRVPRDQWAKIFLAYDNMCQLSRLKAARDLLPLPPPYDEMWTAINKIVDGLHIQNHKDPRCKVIYHPDLYYAVHPSAKPDMKRNTMAAEQTFAWLAKFRKQINAMPKNRQIFFIHRLIIRRNEYLSKCISTATKPVGGAVRTYADRANRT